MTGGDDETIVADRIAVITAKAERQVPAINWQLVVAVGCLVLFLVGFVYVYLGGETSAAPDRKVLTQRAYSDDRGVANRKLFGDTDFAAPEQNEEVEDLKAQIASLAAALEASKPTGEMPEAYRDELAEMRAQMDAMRAEFETQIGQYQQYVTTLEARIAETTDRTPIRPFALQDDKWARAQRISREDDLSQAARNSAPSLVFDASSSGDDDENKETQEKAIIEEFGNAFPETSDVILFPESE